jgi:hypothetical protein
VAQAVVISRAFSLSDSFRSAPPHHDARFSDVGHQVHPPLTPRANDTEIDGHHQLAELIQSDMDFASRCHMMCCW